jgi:tungstate transport system permease protein
MQDPATVLKEALQLIAAGDPGLVALVTRTLAVSLAATLVAALVGLPAAGALAAAAPPVRRVCLPLVRILAMLPAVLIGLLVALALGSRGGAVWGVGTAVAVAVGQGLMALLVVAALAEPVFREVRQRLQKTAWTLGATPDRTWWLLAGEARAGLAAAVAAAFARVVGEAGSALVLGGTSVTLAAAVVTHAERESWSRAVALGVMLSVLAVGAGTVFVKLRDDGC